MYINDKKKKLRKCCQVMFGETAFHTTARILI